VHRCYDVAGTSAKLFFSKTKILRAEIVACMMTVYIKLSLGIMIMWVGGLHITVW
jgi:hypothetical protein